ncbi:hypothetical protein BKA67DRAFT_550563 [Truncatella angustata]|uniref:Peroxin 11C n=1 Tax=Truncatella angustata TaxID=152316 RepID=A0A9P8V089_9PEZI|nr:uncharacterized protein BKA67DRAFT_550563 [Truncatella angustata]KAH6661236.1 hypothetical protein BKA67DRAFT_550563 [Truncatella angustata]KAH8202242.1 hypothetical protein TruAng_003619 [Truncatella angustata]
MTSKEVQSTSDLPSGDPIPAAPGPSSAPKPFPLKALIAAAPSNIDAFLAHLQRAISTPTGIDTVLLFLCYSTRLSSAALELLTRPAITRSANQLLALAQSLPPSTTLVFTNKAFPSPSAALLLILSKRLKAFSALLSDVRTFNRLWGLLGMYFWGRGLFLKLREARLASQSGDEKDRPKIDKLATSIAVTQLVACVVFQALENGAYLAQKGVLEWQPANMVKAYRWSARFWGVFVGLKLTELFADRYKRGQVPKRRRMGDKTVAVFEKEEREWNEEWRKLVSRNMAWFPLTIHWSLEQGLFSELSIGAIASIPGVIQIRDLWNRTA